jgi:putative transposase
LVGRRCDPAPRFGTGMTLGPGFLAPAAQVERHDRAKARRWLVERTHSWFNRCRSVLIRWTKKPANYLGLLHFACAIFCWRHALPG